MNALLALRVITSRMVHVFNTLLATAQPTHQQAINVLHANKATISTLSRKYAWSTPLVVVLPLTL
jgi:hypothetical protein